VLALALLAAGLAGPLLRPGTCAAWIAPMAAAAAALTTGLVDTGEATDAVAALAEPILFLLAAVPLAARLDRLGFFDAAAARTRGRWAPATLWGLASVTVAVLNLDAAVVLLTPLYVRCARCWGVDPVPYAFAPALVACLGSSALPVSNLTNLVFVEHFDLAPSRFLAVLGVPTAVALLVGFAAWRLLVRPTVPAAGAPARATDRSALMSGGAVLAVTAAGFVAGRAVAVAPWVVAITANVTLEVLLRRRGHQSPVWRDVPWGAAGLVAALAVLAHGAGDALPLNDLLGRIGERGDPVLAALVGAGAANLVNNLPALLLGLAALGDAGASAVAWAYLLGVNIGPLLLVTGSLSGILWLDAARKEGLRIGPARYLAVGLAVGGPASAASVAALAIGG